MPQYAYKAKKDDGSVVTGTMQADSERGALDALGRQGVFPLEIVPQDDTMAVDPLRRARKVRRRVRAADVGLFTQQLADLLKAGVPLHRSLSILAEQTSKAALSAIVTGVAKDIASGKPLHEALARHPKSFGPLYVSMVKAGETGGFLEDVLARLAGFIDKDEELKSRIWAAMAYPILLAVVSVAAVTFLMIFFIPRFTEIFDSMKASLPWPTKATMGVSGFVRGNWFWMLPLVGLVPAGWAWFRETPRGRLTVDRLKIGMPLFGDVARKSAIARFTRSLGTMLKSGVPILGALSISKEAMGNVVLMRDIDEASAGVRQGRSLAEILRRSRTFPATVVDMIAVGEEAGNLDAVLVGIADSYDRQVDRATKVFVTLFEPLLLFFMAAVVGFIVISMLLPVFTLASMMGE